jgi:hypothetical protein
VRFESGRTAFIPFGVADRIELLDRSEFGSKRYVVAI